MSEPLHPEKAPTAQKKSGWARRLLQIVGIYGWLFGSLFVAAGRLDWIRGWIAVALWVVGMSTIGLVIKRYNPGLLQEVQNGAVKTPSLSTRFSSRYLCPS